MRRRRQRSRASGGAVVAEEAFDLFLDALANTLGVIMFIALMIVLFSSPPAEAPRADEPSPTLDPSEAREVALLLEQAAMLEQTLAQAPREGDPELRRRAEALDAQLRALRDSMAEVLEQTAADSDAITQANQARQRAMAAAAAIEAQRQRLERRIASLPVTSSFVRVSRFRQDARTPVLLLLSGGRLERADPAPGETRIIPGARDPRPITSIDDARALIRTLLRDAAPSTHRLEVGVWSDSFGEYKLIERLLVDLGFDINPLPLPAGAALEAGTSGIQ